jgi:wyosine [tRNA(Phe)-imidazoG37] synthetase (radical SAM superfamily)
MSDPLAVTEDLEAQITLSYANHSRLSEFDRLVYPVISRRSGGLSLGINLNPDKRCNFDCVYCQVDRSEEHPRTEPSLVQLEQELRNWLSSISAAGYRGYPLRDIGLAGDGEPTSVRILPQVLQLLLDLKREFELHETVKLVLFTNATGIDRKDLLPLWPAFYKAGGEVWCKLDFWDSQSLQQLNRTAVPFERLVEKITRFGRIHPLVLQSCFFSWQSQRPLDDGYAGYVALVQRLITSGVQLKTIQAYTLARQPAEAQARPWNDADMDRIAASLRSHLSVPVALFYESGLEAKA